MSRLGYLGPQGTYSEEAANLYNSNLEKVPYPTISEVFNALGSGEIDEGIVPLENSIEGTVNITLDLLVGPHDLKITNEVVLDINHCLATRPGVGLKDITAIVSHPQAIAQCQHYLAKTLPGVDIMKVNSTAEAARIVAYNSLTWAAIVNVKAAELNGLNVIANQVQDWPDNKTRFVVLGKNEVAQKKGCKTSMIASITDRPGGLYQILKEFALRNINLSKIESRPAKKSLGDYIFYIEMIGHSLEANVSDCLQAIQRQVASIKLLGSYPAFAKTRATVDDYPAWTLEQMRTDIDIIDYQIVELLAQRTRLVGLVGELKKDWDEIRDNSREGEILQRVKQTALDKGFDPVTTEKIYRLLFAHFVHLQQEQNNPELT